MTRAPATDDSALRRLPRIALGVLLAAAAGYIIATTGTLPATVATHCDGDGRPNGWMMAAFPVGLTLWAIALFRRFAVPPAK